MKSSTPRFALLGNFGTGNLGNDGSLEAMLLTIRRLRPDAELICICPNPENIARTYGISGLPIAWPRPAGAWFGVLNALLLKLPGKLADAVHALAFARGVQVLVMPGTGLFGSAGEPALGWPYALFLWCLSARLRRTRIVVVSAGSGSLPNRVGRWLMTSAASMADYRSFRDSISRDRLARYGLDTYNDPVYPDVAFGLPPPPPAILSKGKTPTVGVGVMAYHGWRSTARERAAVYEAYRAKISAFVAWLLDQGHTVRLIIGEDSDLRAVDHVRADIADRDGGASRRVIAEPASSLHEVMRQMNDTDVVVATRFHNVICALIAGRPVISLGYSEPHDALMAEMGLEPFCQHVERLDLALLSAQFNMLMASREEYESRIRATSCKYRALLAQQDDILAQQYF